MTPHSRRAIPPTRTQIPDHPFTRAFPGPVGHVTAASADGVFISYRRSDAGPYARLLKAQLGQRLGGTPRIHRSEA